MPLKFGGTRGELLIGRRVLAELARYQKQGRRLTFALGRVNTFLSEMGQAPDRVRLYLDFGAGRKASHWRTAPITDGAHWRDGTVTIGPTSHVGAK